jgi:hypothetical protein
METHHQNHPLLLQRKRQNNGSRLAAKVRRGRAARLHNLRAVYLEISRLLK